ncbi:MAG: hypothetical protein M3P18_19170, partial [Actinomycetota bacterium]|nr:hypothetical protein [Actinomycetota bacterium]
GPFPDSTGKGLFFRLAPGEHPSHAAQTKAHAHCPQGVVGLFGTPVGGVQASLFERAAMEFGRCVRAQGFRNYPRPEFADGDPVAAFWRLPFPWPRRSFTEAATACVAPLRNYLFSS